MKKPLRIVSLALALTLWAGICTLPAFAQEGDPASQPAASQSTAGSQQSGGSDNGSSSGGSDNGSGSGDGNSLSSTSGVYVTEAVVTTPSGGEVTEVHEGDRINVVLRMVDHPAATHSVTADEIVARVDSNHLHLHRPRRGQPALPGGGRRRPLLFLCAALPGCDLQRRAATASPST